MADYKIVDAEKLEEDLTVLADAIRQRSGTAEKLAFPQGMAETVKTIPAEGAVLPELTNPAAATDLARDKQLIDAGGNIVTGTLGEATEGVTIHSISDAELHSSAGSTAINLAGIYFKNAIGDNTKGVILRPGSKMNVREVPTSLFGNAAPEQVAKGATFTSAAGLLVEGTHEYGEGITLPELGDTAAQPTDIVAGKSLYDDDGNLVTGTLLEANETQERLWATSDYYFGGTPGGTVFYVGGTYRGNTDGIVVRPGAGLAVRNAPTEFFGTAEANQVAKGATFTSAAGLLVEGTLEPGSGDNTALIQLLERSAGELTVPEGCTRIGDYAFYYNAAVTAVSLPDTVTNIGYRSFYQCTGLSELRLSAGLDSIDTHAFYNCKGLTSLTFRSTPSSIASNAFGACSGLTTIHVPWASGAVADAPWGATNAVIHYNDSGEGA